MPTMVPRSGKAEKIRQQILGSPRNKHTPYSRDPRIRESDKQRVIQALLTNISSQDQLVPSTEQGML